VIFFFISTITFSMYLFSKSFISFRAIFCFTNSDDLTHN
jgi:hypothetical protein